VRSALVKPVQIRFVAAKRVEAGTHGADHFAQQRFEALRHRPEAESAKTGWSRPRRMHPA
jgi:hypothetical protein